MKMLPLPGFRDQKGIVIEIVLFHRIRWIYWSENQRLLGVSWTGKFDVTQGDYSRPGEKYFH